MKTISTISLLLLLALGLKAQISRYDNKIIILKIKQAETLKSSIDNTFDKIRQVANDPSIEIKPVFENSDKRKQVKNSKYNLANFYKIELKSSDTINYYIHQLNQIENIEYAEPYPVAQVFEVTDDPKIDNQYYLAITNAFEAFNYSTGDTNIVIGIVDSGVDLLHEDLRDNYKYNYEDPINGVDDDGDGYTDNYYGWDMADNDFNPQNLVNDNGEANYHGTKVAGIASAKTNNAIGIAGIGYNTRILPIKAMNSSGYIVAGYEGIIYAADHGCHIINCSWGSNTYSKFAQDVINYASLEKKCLVVAAAGNTGASSNGRPDLWFYPASYDNVLSVAATGSSDMRWSGSSYATTVDVCAPGENIYSTRQFNTYSSGSGTSYAAPLVAGLAGLVKAVNPNYTQKQLAEQIRVTSDVIDTLPENIFYKRQLGGRINALRALTVNDIPSIRLDSFIIEALNQRSLQIGDTLQVSFIASNYLAQASNTTIRLTTNTDYFSPINSIYKTGKLNTFESVNNHSNPFLLEVTKNIPLNEKVWFIFEMQDEGYADYQIIEKKINNNYLQISENKITTTLTSNGHIGYADKTENLGVGFVYNNSNNFLNYGGIILGNSNTNIASALLEIEEFNTELLVDTTRNSENVLVGKTAYSALPETGLPIAITQTTLASNDISIQYMLVHLYNLKNTSNTSVEGLKLSHFMDWNLYSGTANQIGYVAELNLSYTYSNANEIIYTGICLLNDMKSVSYGFDMIPGGNGGIDITNGFNNDLKWYTMNNSRLLAGNNGDSIDVASMLTTDFFSLNPNDSIEIAFAHVVSPNYADLITMVMLARADYQVSAIENTIASSYSLFPNPAKSELSLVSTKLFEKTKVTIYDQTGRLQYSNDYLGSNVFTINISNLEQGIYIVNIENERKKVALKFIKVP